MENRKILKILEYTPFGFIPGVLRLAHVAGRSVCSLFYQKERIEKIDRIASQYLTQEKSGTKLVRETIRGIVDCIPIVNTVCLGIHDLFFCKKRGHPKSSSR